MSYKPITWRNVNSQAPVGAAIQGIGNANQAFQNMISGFRQIGEHYDNREIAANERDFRTYLNSFDSPEAFQAAQQAGEVQARLDGYGDFRNAEMQSMMDGRLGAIRDQVQGAAKYQDWVNNREAQPLIKQFDSFVSNGQLKEADALMQQISPLASADAMSGLQQRLLAAKSSHAVAAARNDVNDFSDERDWFTVGLEDAFSNEKPKGGGMSPLEEARALQKKVNNGTATPEQEQFLIDRLQSVQSQRTNERLIARKLNGISPNLPADVQTKIENTYRENLAGKNAESLYPQEYQSDVQLQMGTYLQANPSMRTNELIMGTEMPLQDAERTFADAIVSRTDKDGEGDNTLDSETSILAAEAFNLIFQEGVSDGKGNKVTLPMSEGAVKLVANSIEADRWFERDASPEEIANSFITKMGADKKFQDYQKFLKEQTKVKNLAKTKYGLNNPLDDLKQKVFANREKRRSAAISKAEQANIKRLKEEAKQLNGTLKNDLASFPPFL